MIYLFFLIITSHLYVKCSNYQEAEHNNECIAGMNREVQFDFFGTDCRV